MKRITLILLSLAIVGVASAQNNNDRAVIPVGVTLNSIMRLTIVSGGNIEFSFNTIRDYEDGISYNTQYDTRFTIASSVDYAVSLQTEDGNLIRTDLMSDTVGAGGVGDAITLNLNYLEFDLTNNGGASITGAFLSGGTALSQSQTIIEAEAGGQDDNDFTLRWQCGVTTSLLDNSPPAGRYGTNAFLILSSQ